MGPGQSRASNPPTSWRATIAIARRIAANGPIAVRQAKQAIHRGLQMSLSDGLAFEIEAYNRLVPPKTAGKGCWRSTSGESPCFGDNEPDAVSFDRAVGKRKTKMPGDRSPGILMCNAAASAQPFFTSGHTLLSSGMKASSAGMVATRL